MPKVRPRTRVSFPGNEDYGHGVEISRSRGVINLLSMLLSRLNNQCLTSWLTKRTSLRVVAARVNDQGLAR